MTQRTDQGVELRLIQRMDSIEASLNDRMSVIEQSLDAQQLADSENVTPPPTIVNLIDNADYNWSKLAYTVGGTTPSTAGDTNYDAYNWYRQDKTLALLVEDQAHALKSSGDSTFAANEGANTDIPRWDRTNGWAEVGSVGGTNYDLACPLSTNFSTASQRLYFQVLATLRTATAWPAVNLFAGIWDNTNTVNGKQFLTGTAFTLNGAVFGGAGATSHDYKVIATTDYGAMLESTVKTVASAPNPPTPTNGIALSWQAIQGVVSFDIYRKTSGTTYLIFQVRDGATSYNDDGQVLKTVSGFPTPGPTQGTAYVETPAGIFVPDATWRVFDLSILVPPGYNQSNTTGKQWLRFGLTGATTDARQLLADRVGLSHAWGAWTISHNDLAIVSLGNIPSIGPTSSSQGPPSPSGGGPPDDGSGQERCCTPETMITICDRDGRSEQSIPARHVRKGMYFLGASGRANKVQRVIPGWSDTIINIRTENGAGRRCSPSDLWLTGLGDLHCGTPARTLCEGMPVLTRKKKKMVASPIVSLTYEPGDDLRIFQIANDHVYFAGDAASHNLKLMDGATF